MDDMKSAVEQAVLRGRAVRLEAALLRQQCEETRAIAAQALHLCRLAFAEFRGVSVNHPNVGG